MKPASPKVWLTLWALPCQHQVPFTRYRLLPGNNRFTDALQLIDTETVLHQIQSEFAGLCNQVIAADHQKITSKEGLGQIVRKVCGFLNLGLARLSQANKRGDVGHWAALIKRFPLSRFFRLGYGLVLELKWRAEKWHDRSWFSGQGLPLSFWDEEWLGVLGGVLLKKPLFFDNYRTGQMYRDFATYEEVQATEQVLSQIMAFDSLLRLMDLKPGAFGEPPLYHLQKSVADALGPALSWPVASAGRAFCTGTQGPV